MKLDQVGSTLAAIHDFNINVQSREIYLHSFYSSGDGDTTEPGVEFRTATTFLKNLNFLNDISSDEIIIHQHITGGFWNDGIAIYDALTTSNSKTIMIAHAHATSMSSVTLQGATTRLLMPHVEVLIHDGTNSIYGIPSEIISAVKAYEKTIIAANNIYAKRCVNGKYFKQHKMTEKETASFIRSKIKKYTDWWMEPEEAIYYGFADGIVGQFKRTEPVKRKPKRK